MTFVHVVASGDGIVLVAYVQRAIGSTFEIRSPHMVLFVQGEGGEHLPAYLVNQYFRAKWLAFGGTALSEQVFLKVGGGHQAGSFEAFRLLLSDQAEFGSFKRVLLRHRVFSAV